MQAPLKTISSITLKLYPIIGTDINDVIREALILSLLENRDSEFEFNGKKLTIIVKNVIHNVYMQY